MTECRHPAEQRVRTVYYTMCGACKKILMVTFCNYASECHPDCALAAACVQNARQSYHAEVALAVPPDLLPAARGASSESRESNG